MIPFDSKAFPVRVEGAFGQRFSIERLMWPGNDPFGACRRFEVDRTLEVNLYDMQGRSYWQLVITPQFLLQVRDAINLVLSDRAEAPIRVELVQRPRRRKKRLSPAAALEDASETALSPEERAIHRRMLEGR